MRAKDKILVVAFVLVPIHLLAQTTYAISRFAILVGGGFSNFLLEDGFLYSSIETRPKLGIGATFGLAYELEYNHFLLQTGFGIAYSANKYTLPVDGFSVFIQEYPLMQYHYEVDQYVETTNYGIGYIPIMIGSKFKHGYFLVGAKMGVVSFINATNTEADVTIWATDDDIMNPLKNMPTHGLCTHHFVNKIKIENLSSFNAILSAEIGTDISVRFRKKQMNVDEPGMHQNLKKGKVLPQYRLSLFADYGFKLT